MLRWLMGAVRQLATRSLPSAQLVPPLKNLPAVVNTYGLMVSG